MKNWNENVEVEDLKLLKLKWKIYTIELLKTELK